MKNICNWFTPIASIIGALSITTINMEGTVDHYNFIILTLVLMHTCISIKDYASIFLEKWKVLLYMYAIFSFLVFRNSTILMMLNIMQSWETIYILTRQESEVGINKNNS